MAKLLDTSYYDGRRRDWLADEDTRAEYERARLEIEQIDAVIRSLDELREDAGSRRLSWRGAWDAIPRALGACSRPSWRGRSCR